MPTFIQSSKPTEPIGLTDQNKHYWQHYAPGDIPSAPGSPPQTLLNMVTGPILDAGTGNGILAEQLAASGFDVYGIDIAGNVIEQNVNKHTKVKYSVADITTKTKLPDKFFDLIIFKFVLTSIHKEAWNGLNKEVNRILKPGGKVWVLEPLVSPSYQARYDLTQNLITDPHCVYVFKNPTLAGTIKSRADLQKAIASDKVSRIVKHYTLAELTSIFSPLNLQSHRDIKVISPSGFDINTFEGIFQDL